MVALLWLQFWIINARELARRIVRACIHCVRYRPVLLQQVKGTLPRAMLAITKPFSRCGVDFCGPISTYLRIRGKPQSKSYLTVFICLVIEVVTDLTTGANYAVVCLIGKLKPTSNRFARLTLSVSTSPS